MRFPQDLPILYDLLRESVSARSDDLAKILVKARDGKGLSLSEAAVLLMAPEEYCEDVFRSAAIVNERIFLRTITFYGVVYIHDACVNACSYCGDSVLQQFKRRFLTKSQFLADVQALLDLHPLKEICILMGEAPTRFDNENLGGYLVALREIYKERIILNIPPPSREEFQGIARAVPAEGLQFRVFQETYDQDVYRVHHTKGPKMDFHGRIDSQRRAWEAGFGQIGFGVLFGLNHKPNGPFFETLAMIAHALELKNQFGKNPTSMSFPRLQPIPSSPQQQPFCVPASVTDRDLIRCIAVAKLAVPTIRTILTCREAREFRSAARPIINIEDFQARPGPGGNSMEDVRTQMFLGDMRPGVQVRDEMLGDGYDVR